MTEHLQTITQTHSHAKTLREDAIRNRLSRSPHPYHKHNFELPYASENITTGQASLRSTHMTDEDDVGDTNLRAVPDGYFESTNSDSGTEADDEAFLKGLPAPRIKPHKGLRGDNGAMSSSPSPLLSPAILDDELPRRTSRYKYATTTTTTNSKAPAEEDIQRAREKIRRKRRIEIARRATETLLLLFVGNIIYHSEGVAQLLYSWRNELVCQLLVISSLIAIYPIRLLRHLDSRTLWKSKFALTIPADFDPAPLLYPPILSMLVSILLSVSDPNCLLPSMILAISTLPKRLIPTIGGSAGRDLVHWFFACAPLLVTTSMGRASRGIGAPPIIPEILVLLPALHQALCTTLHYLTTTSLLSAELQLLSTALISLLLRASSPQAIILKSLLWGGGIGVLLSCTYVLKWGVALARVPKWRFRRSDISRRSGLRFSKRSLSFGTSPLSFFGGDAAATDSSEDDTIRLNRAHTLASDSRDSGESVHLDGIQTGVVRRYTSPTSATRPKASDRTPSGRKKRTASQSVQAFFNLTYAEARFRKWIYAGYVYVCILIIIMVGIREYVGKFALARHEPIGWALGYLFGDLHWFRLEVVIANLQRWICLPPRDLDHKASCQFGWVEHIRHSDFGLANTRLILSAYWLAIIIVGLAIVFNLSAVYEVDTRRKVFHFMMVAMLLPATYVDPTFAALALSLMLAIFLLLDLFRASQLPPLSKSLAYFLTPYVDGRDLKGPVVISHIFLLIGCAIPLWLSLGSLPRADEFEPESPFAGWELATREVSMVSGVICVGMGDAAASLIGRRYGRHKWLWGGGKSIEGSIAFSIAVASALMLAKAWLRIGGWQANNVDGWGKTLGKAGIAATVASLTEAVLTGGNDNVVVPVVLWCCVKGLDV